MASNMNHEEGHAQGEKEHQDHLEKNSEKDESHSPTQPHANGNQEHEVEEESEPTTMLHIGAVENDIHHVGAILNPKSEPAAPEVHETSDQSHDATSNIQHANHTTDSSENQSEPSLPVEYSNESKKISQDSNEEWIYSDKPMPSPTILISAASIESLESFNSEEERKIESTEAAATEVEANPAETSVDHSELSETVHIIHTEVVIIEKEPEVVLIVEEPKDVILEQPPIVKEIRDTKIAVITEEFDSDAFEAPRVIITQSPPPKPLRTSPIESRGTVEEHIVIAEKEVVVIETNEVIEIEQEAVVLAVTALVIEEQEAVLHSQSVLIAQEPVVIVGEPVEIVNPIFVEEDQGVVLQQPFEKEEVVVIVKPEFVVEEEEVVISDPIETPIPSPDSAKQSRPPVAKTSDVYLDSPVAPPRKASNASRSSRGDRPSKLVFSEPNTPQAPARGFSRLYSATLPRNAVPPTKETGKPKKSKSMFSWLGGDSSKKKNKEVLDSVSDGLRKIYKQKLLPLEEHYKFHEFHSPALDDPDFDAKPMILLVGQYSTGKTTFIRYLLEQDFPGIRIGPEPTTDRFIAVMHGEEEGVVPGNALVVDAKKQFRALSGFGNAFLNRFQCSSLNNQVLESVTIVDTPGILSGEKQRIDRGYDFTGVLEWFAERVDRIILLFDAHKLDISDEFKRCIEALGGNEDKIRIVLNKSDMVDHQQLMRVYGALMWSLGKVFKTPEVSRVYLGSFWDHPLHYDINRRLFQDEQHDLFQDLQALPRNAALRKLNDLIKRARLAKVHAYIIAELRKQMPSMIGKEKKKKELIQNLDKIFEQLQREHNISPGDFPDVNKMREKLQTQDFAKFNPIKPKLLEVVDGMLATDIARLMAQIPKEEAQLNIATNGTASEQQTVKGGAFSQAVEAETPFGFGRGEGFDKGANEAEWVVSRERVQADTTFESLGPIDGFVSGRAAKEHMMKSKLPNSVLGKIWKLADVDKDGQLDADEFALSNYLINLKLEGHELPLELPKHLIPPSKRDMPTVYPTLDDE